MKFFKLLIVVSHLSFFISMSQVADYDKKNRNKSIDSLTVNFEKLNGLIIVYKNKEKVYFEIDDSLLTKDLLMVTRIVKSPSDFQAYKNAGSKTSEQLIQFVKKKEKILLIQKSYLNIADEKDPISQSVTKNNFSPILAAFQIKNLERKKYLIDVTNYFNKDSPGFNILSSSEKKQYAVGGIDPKRSFLDTIKSYPKNLEIRHTLTFKSSKPPRNNFTNTISFQINHSIILLPNKPMSLRYADDRIGWLNIKKYDYSSPDLKSTEIKIIKRWRLEPSDLNAYMRGELVEPIKPIIFYLDKSTPLKWRHYFKLGVEDWNSVFEKAGFKNAIVAKDSPSLEENEDFSLEDIRYSIIHYVASTTRNARGLSIVDPRSGEIIQSDVIWYHNHLKSYRNRYLLETGASNPKARTLDTDEKDIGLMIRRVISHEVGHALGLPHNMKSSSAYPVDSLRSDNFTQKMGIATTIMDYARFNYVSQPNDDNKLFIRKLGPYDDYSIEWGYRFFTKETLETEKVFLKDFVDKKSLNPMFMYGTSGIDPNVQTENIGDNPIKASNYGLNNLKIVASKLDEWTTKEGNSYNDLNELYNEMLSVYKRYIFHVVKIIGGVNETLLFKGQNGIPFMNVDYNKQISALIFLDNNLWSTQRWLMEPDLISKIKQDGILERIQNIQYSALNNLLEYSKLNRMLSTSNTLKGKALDPSELVYQLYLSLYDINKKLDNSLMVLQIRFLVNLNILIEETKLNPSLKSGLLNIQNLIYKNVKKSTRASNSKNNDHYEYLKRMIENKNHK